MGKSQQRVQERAASEVGKKTRVCSPGSQGKKEFQEASDELLQM